MYRTIWIGLILTGCGSKMDEATVKGVVEAAFQEHNSTNGRYGWELAGKGQWFDGTAFDKECLIENELAYPNHSKIGQISPAYDVQHMITSSTKRGYCLDMGEGLSYVVDSIAHVSESGSMDIQNVALRFEIKDPSPWFSCLKEEAKSRTVRVENLDGTPKLNANDTVTFQEKNGCGNPVPKAEKRNPTARPTAEPTGKPTIEEVRSLAQKFDDALFERDFDKAYGLVSCVNLYENSKWGTCSLAEVLALGPSTHGESRAEDGAPWLEYTLYDLSKLEKVVTDKLKDLQTQLIKVRV